METKLHERKTVVTQADHFSFLIKLFMFIRGYFRSAFITFSFPGTFFDESKFMFNTSYILERFKYLIFNEWGI